MVSKNEFTFVCHLIQKLEIQVLWDLFNKNTIASAPSSILSLMEINKVNVTIKSGNESIQGCCTGSADQEVEQINLVLNNTERITIPIDGQTTNPGRPSLRECIARIYGSATWLSQLSGFPASRRTDSSSGSDSDGLDSDDDAPFGDSD